MSFFCTANGPSPGRYGKSFDLILSGITKANQLEIVKLSCQTFQEDCTCSSVKLSRQKVINIFMVFENTIWLGGC